MGFKHKPVIWLTVSLILTFIAGMLFMYGSVWQGILASFGALWSGGKVVSETVRVRRSVDYLISAAMNGDFSYKFPETEVSANEREINRQLNRLVEHLENLTRQAREEEQFRSFVMNLVDIGIVVANKRGDVLHSNRAAKKLLSVSVLTDIRQIPLEMPGLDIRKTTAKLHGEEIQVVTLADISEMRQEAEIESLEKLIRVLTHEIMNSLTPVNMISESLVKELGEEDYIITENDMRQRMDVIRSSSEALMEFVRNFRRYTVVPEPKPQVVSVKPFLQRQLAIAQEYDKSGMIDMRLLVFPPDMMMYTDVNLLGQVLTNILKNAVEASPMCINIEATVRDDESVEITVSNDGELIPDDVYPQIFTPFFTTKQDGNGIGLSLSRRIIARLGGTLTLSIRPHTGFTILLK